MALVAAVVVQRGHAVKSLRVLALTRYGVLGASSRLRFLQYFPALQAAGIQLQWQALFGDAALGARYKRGQYGVVAALVAFGARMQAMLNRRDFDVVWVEKEALPYFPLWIESALLSGVPYVLDYDDAVFHNYDQHAKAWVRHLFGHRLDGLMARASLVVAGNSYLEQRALDAGAPWVEVVPTVIDLVRYPAPCQLKLVQPGGVDSVPGIVWIGSPSTVAYLQVIREPLRVLSKRVPFVLRVIGGGAVDLPGVRVESVHWTEAAEVESIKACHVGVMPLTDSPWERGKCGYKLIQYMACGLPVVASPVGVNSSIVQEGVNGYLAKDAQAWANRLEQLLTSVSLRTKMGAAGRQRVEQEYCLQVTGPRLANWLHKVAKKGG